MRPKPKPIQEEEPVEVLVSIPETEFPERFKVRGKRNGQEYEISYSRSQMEEYYERAYAISRTSGLANCHTWMEDLKCDYCAAVRVMDIMEYRDVVKPIVVQRWRLLKSFGSARKFIGKRT